MRKASNENIIVLLKHFLGYHWALFLDALPGFFPWNFLEISSPHVDLSPSLLLSML